MRPRTRVRFPPPPSFLQIALFSLGIEFLFDAERLSRSAGDSAPPIALPAEVMGNLVVVMWPRPEQSASSFHKRMLAARLRDPEFRSEFERVRAELFEQLAPATEGPIVNSGRPRRGWLVFGDADE